MTKPEIRLLRAEEVAEMLGCSKWLVYDLAQRGELPSVRIGRSVRFDPEDVAAFVNQRRGRKEAQRGRQEAREELHYRLLPQGKAVQGDGRPVPEGGGGGARETAG